MLTTAHELRKSEMYDKMSHIEIRPLRSLVTSGFVLQNKFAIGITYLTGCALGGGDWEVVLPMIGEEFKDYHGKVEIWEL